MQRRGGLKTGDDDELEREKKRMVPAAPCLPGRDRGFGPPAMRGVGLEQLRRKGRGEC